MFDFKGTNGRAEYFTYAVTSFLVMLILTAAVFLYSAFNWTSVMPQEMLNEMGRPSWAPPINLMTGFAVVWIGSQLPMLALTVRRLRDQYASYWALAWLAIPLLGPVILFGYGFVPTFRDHEVVLADGTRMMRSRQLSDNRFRNILITGAVVIGGTAAVVSSGSESLADTRPRGGRKMRVNPKASIFKKGGGLDQTKVVGGTRAAHVRTDGTMVKTARQKYTWRL
jgi:uncharacterized membrane protein YhaH (DUF805 family)